MMSSDVRRSKHHNALSEQLAQSRKERSRVLSSRVPRAILAAIVPPLAAFAMQSVFWSTLSPFAWFLFYPTLFISSWLGGMVGGVGATLLSTALVCWYFIPPERTLAIEPRYFTSVGVFIAMGFTFSLFHERLRRANRDAAAALAGAEHANESLQKVINERRVFAALIENSSDFIGIADPDGKPNYLNAAGRRMVGLSADYPVENTEISDYYPLDQRAFASNVIVKAMIDEGHWQGETCFRHWQTEEAIPVSDTHFMIRDPDTGRTLGMGTVTRDISDIKRARDEDEANNRKLEQANQEVTRLYEKTGRELDQLKNQMFANVSHELRTPLTLILGPTHQLLAAGELSEKARAALLVIERNGRTLLGHVDDLLEVSKLEAQEIELRYAQTDLAQLVRFVAGHFAELAQEKNIALTIEAGEELWSEVDPERLQRVLLNLLSNAFKFTPAGGRVRIRARPAGDERLVVEVADSGPGIPVEKREVVFERFRQLEAGATRGTGLGLTIVHELVALHQGSIAITDAPEGGALFTVEIPRAAPAGIVVGSRATEAEEGISRQQVQRAVEELRRRPAVPGGVSAPAAGGDGLVLVVEDNPEMNHFIAQSLADRYRVAVAFDGREGLDRARALKPDLIVSDVMMPEMGGADLVREIRKLDELAATPIILLTARAEDERLRVALLRAGAQDWLSKPFFVEELQARAANLVARKRAEESLRFSEAKSSGIVSISADAIISIDEGQRITMFNEGAEKIFGYSKQEAIGAPLEILIPERFRAVHRQYIERFAASRQSARQIDERDAAIVGLRKNGAEFPAAAAISQLDLGGKKLLTVALRDVTEPKRRESEQRFLAEVGSVLASTLDYEETLTRVAQLAVRELADLCVVDIFEEDGEVRRLKVVGRDPSQTWLRDLVLRVPLERKLPHLAWSILANRQPVLMQGLPPETVASFSQSEEHLRVLRAVDPKSVIALPLLVHGTLVGMLALVSSRSARVYGPADLRLAQELVQRAALAIDNAWLYRKAQRAIQARDDVLGIVAHDLRNPLGNIVLQSSLLQRGDSQPERRSQKPAEAIRRSASRMNRIIQDLLDMTRIEAGRLPLELTRVPAGQILSDSVKTQETLAASASLELRLEAPPRLPEVRADRDRLLQVFENLIGNAIKFTNPGGRITVGAMPKDEELLFWVADSGAGIPAEDLPHVFDRFWQSRKPQRVGAGLGLSIAKGIVEAHGGRIWVEASPGRGSTFFFAIPQVEDGKG